MARNVSGAAQWCALTCAATDSLASVSVIQAASVPPATCRALTSRGAPTVATSVNVTPGTRRAATLRYATQTVIKLREGDSPVDKVMLELLLTWLSLRS